MFGYACRETPTLMPAPLFYSHKILKLLADARHAVRRPVAEQSRGLLRLDDPSESWHLVERFDAILASAQPGIEPSVSGL